MILADENVLPRSDVCIVGAGPVGLALAFKLEALGLTVTLLEMGDEGSGPAQSAGDVEFRNGHHASSMAVSRSGIGGTSALWGGRCVGFDDLDFDRRDHVPFSGWPIPHSEISSYYPEALSFLGCKADDPVIAEFDVADKTVGTDAIERWSRDPALGPVYASRLASSAKIRLLTGACVKDINLDGTRSRVESLRVRLHAKEFEVAAGTYVLAGGGLENARLLLGLADHVPGVREHAGPALGAFYQGHLTGYIALVHFQDPSHAGVMAFKGDAAGQTYRQRLQIAAPVQLEQRLLNTVFWIDAVSIADPIHGSGALSLCYLFLAATGLYRFLSKGLAPTAWGRHGIDSRRHLRNVREDLPSPRELLSTVLALVRPRRGKQTLINPKGRYLLRYHAEQVPNPQSKVSLKPSNGPDGLRALSVDYRVTEQDITSVLRSHEIVDHWLRQNGIGRLEYLHDVSRRKEAVTAQAFDGYHQIGLTRMGVDSSEGPADTDCRVRGVSNLYLAGSCLFPTGGHANPTLPAVALALRLAGHLGGTAHRPKALA